jgi:hypothetical protein
MEAEPSAEPAPAAAEEGPAAASVEAEPIPAAESEGVESSATAVLQETPEQGAPAQELQTAGGLPAGDVWASVKVTGGCYKHAI